MNGIWYCCYKKRFTLFRVKEKYAIDKRAKVIREYRPLYKMKYRFDKQKMKIIMHCIPTNHPLYHHNPAMSQSVNIDTRHLHCEIKFKMKMHPFRLTNQFYLLKCLRLLCEFWIFYYLRFAISVAHFGKNSHMSAYLLWQCLRQWLWKICWCFLI